MEALVLRPDSQPLSRNIEDYPEGIIIPIDKPYRWTSADVIRKVKFAAIRHFGKKNLKVGHAGTLDPLATGVLLVCIGKATKLAETLQSHDKEYIAGITFGATTPSYDLEKEIDRFFPHEHITAESVAEALPAFIGEQDQIAPLFSAKSVDGIRAYELARKLYSAVNGCNSGDPLSSARTVPLAGGGMSPTLHSINGGNPASDIDAAAEELLRVARINISELELLSFESASSDRGLENRATPLAAGVESDYANSPVDFCSEQPAAAGVVGARSEGVGGVVFQSPIVEADVLEPSSCQPLKGASSRINVTDNSALGLPRAVVRMACSKGTYVRAFARDLGEALASGAHLDSLQRSRSGIFRVEDALTVEQAIECLKL